MQFQKEVRDLVETACLQGWDVRPTDNGKIIWKSPNPDIRPITSPLKIGNGRAKANLIAELRRGGLELVTTAQSKPTIEEVEEMTEQEMKDLLRQGLSIAGPEAMFMRIVMEALDAYNRDSHAACNTALSSEINVVLEANIRMEKEITEISFERDGLQVKVERLAVKVSDLGKELVECQQELAAAQERAITSENKIKTLKQIFGNDK